MALLLLRPPAASAPSEAPPAPLCPSSTEFELPDEPLDNLAAAVKSGQPVEILALGSASTVAHGKDGFPQHMVRTLEAALPHVAFHLAVQGGRGLTAETMLDDLRAALKRGHIALVLWQTGTVEAVRGIHPEELRGVLEEGAELVAAQSGDLVLIDPQFSRFLRANTDIDPYERAMVTAASLPNTSLFHRFDLMHAWVDSGTLDLERTDTAEHPAAVAMLNQCLGAALGRFVLNGIGR
jgi:hypothetical protein